MAQRLLTSAHLLEMFMPYRSDEARMIEVLNKAASFGFYRGVELGIFFDPENRKVVREILEKNKLHCTTFVTPYVKDQKISLSSLDESERKKAVELVKRLGDYAAQAGYHSLGIPGGDDPAPVFRGLAKCALAESMEEIAEHLKQYHINLLIEPLDRYAYKKQLIGPMEETCVWFKSVHEKSPNAYIHWDSAHEALGGIDLMKSIEFAAPFIASFHLCDAITDPNHPCFGDLHIDVATPPDWETEGFLTPQIGAQILKKIASYEKPVGVDNVYVSVEILGHPGNKLWKIEEHARGYLKKAFELAGMEC